MVTTIQIIWTLIAFVVFIGIVVWAWAGKRKKSFDEAANLPFTSEGASDQNAIDEEKDRV